jgi:hypothetical protein
VLWGKMEHGNWKEPLQSSMRAFVLFFNISYLNVKCPIIITNIEFSGIFFTFSAFPKLHYSTFKNIPKGLIHLVAIFE